MTQVRQGNLRAEQVDFPYFNGRRGRFAKSQVIKLIEADGWYLARQRSSHRPFKHPTKPGLVTVAGHPPKVLAPKPVESILRQAGLSP